MKDMVATIAEHLECGKMIDLDKTRWELISKNEKNLLKTKVFATILTNKNILTLYTVWKT